NLGSSSELACRDLEAALERAGDRRTGVPADLTEEALRLCVEAYGSGSHVIRNALRPPSLDKEDRASATLRADGAASSASGRSGPSGPGARSPAGCAGTP